MAYTSASESSVTYFGLAALLTVGFSVQSCQKAVCPPQPEVNEPNQTETPPQGNKRLYYITKDGPIHLSDVLVPGYFTLVTFSASWCIPCGVVRENYPRWLDSLPNLVIVDIDLFSNSTAEDERLLAAYGTLTPEAGIQLPAALLFDPWGHYAVAPPQEGWQVARDRPETYRLPPLRERLIERVTKFVQSVPLREPVGIGYSAPFSRLKELERQSSHYAVGTTTDSVPQSP